MIFFVHVVKMHIYIDISSDEIFVSNMIMKICTKHSLYCEIGPDIPCDLFITDSEQVRHIYGNILLCIIPKCGKENPTVYRKIEILIEAAILRASKGPASPPNSFLPFCPLLIGAIVIGLVTGIDLSILK